MMTTMGQGTDALAQRLQWRPPPGLERVDTNQMMLGPFVSCQRQPDPVASQRQQMHQMSQGFGPRGFPGFDADPGVSEGPSASQMPPMPWRLLGKLDGLKEHDRSFDVDDVSTGASSEDKEQQGDTDNWFCDNADDAKDPHVGAEDEVNTLMIKHIPCRSTQEEVLEAIAEVGFSELYNFFYLPIRRGHHQNFGYAFIGFIDSAATKDFATAMTGYCFKNRNSNKKCEVAPARVQGFRRNVEHYQKHRGGRREALSKVTMCV